MSIMKIGSFNGDSMKSRVLFFAFAALLVAACTKAVEQPIQDLQVITVTASQEAGPDTRTTLMEGGTTVYWEPGDEIKLFSGSGDGKFVAQNTTLATVAEFTGTLSIEAGQGSSIWGLYPYRADARFDGQAVTTTLPAAQTGRAGSFGEDTNIALACSDSRDLVFYNVCGGVRFSLAQTGIKSVTFEGLGGEILAGSFSVTMQDGKPAVSNITKGEKVLTLNAPDGGVFETGRWYYFSAIPATLSKGFKMTFYKDDSSAIRSSGKSVTIKRGTFGTIANADEDLVFEGGSSQSQIKIDGDFADWAAAKNLAGIRVSDGASAAGIRLMKAVADESKVYIYFEYELTSNQGGCAPFDIIVDSDNNPATGARSWLWAQSGFEFFIESGQGFLDGDDAVGDLSDMAAYRFVGENGQGAWDASGLLQQEDAWGFAESAGVVANMIAKVELSFLRSVVDAESGSALAIGLLAHDYTWSETGILPSSDFGSLLEIPLDGSAPSHPWKEEDYTNVAPAISSGDKILVTNPNVEKFLTEVSYPDKDYSYTKIYDYYGGFNQVKYDENGNPDPNGEIVKNPNSDRPQTYSIRWKVGEEPGGNLTLHLQDNLSWSQDMTVSSGKGYVEITNLVPDAHYTYKVTASNGTVMTQGTFDTYGHLHQVFFHSGCRNGRDLGGWQTVDGKKVKYRRIYRGGRMQSETVNTSGKAEIVAEGIGAQLDLRGKSDMLSAPAVAGMDFLAPCIEQGGKTMLVSDAARTKACFEFIVKNLRAGKGVYYHCSLGRDRTGTLTILLLGLLGVRDGDISKEYEVTYFAPIGYSISSSEISSYDDLYFKNNRTRWVYSDVAPYFWSLAGDGTFADGVEKYLLDVAGVSQKDIDDYRSLMLE